MELVKINEAYNVSDELENGWKTSGQIVREESGELRINLSTQKDSIYLGNYSYNIYRGNDNVNINYSVTKEVSDEYHAYCDKLVDDILAELAKPSSEL